MSRKNNKWTLLNMTTVPIPANSSLEETETIIYDLFFSNDVWDFSYEERLEYVQRRTDLQLADIMRVAIKYSSAFDGGSLKNDFKAIINKEDYTIDKALVALGRVPFSSMQVPTVTTMVDSLSKIASMGIEVNSHIMQMAKVLIEEHIKIILGCLAETQGMRNLLENPRFISQKTLYNRSLQALNDLTARYGSLFDARNTSLYANLFNFKDFVSSVMGDVDAKALSPAELQAAIENQVGRFMPVEGSDLTAYLAKLIDDNMLPIIDGDITDVKEQQNYFIDK
jgi:hypothetical protein